jgi:hypothetical protein
MIMRWHGKSALVALVAAALTLPAAPAVAADATRSAQWWLSTLKVATAHQITQGRGVTVAVIDTGVFVHEDLKDRVLAGMDYTVPTGGNGQVDTDGHGTYIAGLISGRGHGTGLGILGIAPSARILPLRVAATRATWPTDDTIAKAIALARKRGAKIIHLPAMKGDQATMDAVAKAVAAGVLVIAATGNTAAGDPQIMPPAAWPGVVAVTGVDKAGKFAPLYVAGAKVDFSAPGVGVITTDKVAGGYVTPASTGTASAITAGVAALVWAKYPKLKAAQVLQAMQKGATDKGAKGRDSQYGYGVVNAANSLLAAQAIASPSPSASPSVSPSPSPSEEVMATEAAAAPPAADTKDEGGMSPLALLGIGGGILFLLVLAALVVLLIRRSQGGALGQPAIAGAPSPPPSPWAPQQVHLPQPVSAPVPPHHPSTPPQQVQTQQVQTQQVQTQQVQAQQVPMPVQPQLVSMRQEPTQPQPMVHRPAVDEAALNQPTVAIPRPRFAFPSESAPAAEPSIYDTATFPVVEEDRR